MKNNLMLYLIIFFSIFNIACFSYPESSYSTYTQQYTPPILPPLIIPKETWSDFIDRAETMVYSAQRGINVGNHNTWSYDKWGALLATYDWLEYAYENIYKNTPHLTEYQRNIYGDIYRRRVEMYNDLVYLYGLVYKGNVHAVNTITDRWYYWKRHLDNGGIIDFN